QQRRLADARIPAEQGHRARNESAPQRPVQLGQARRQAHAGLCGGCTQGLRERPRAGRRSLTGPVAARIARAIATHQRIPLSAAWTLTDPLRGLALTGGAKESDTWL